MSLKQVKLGRLSVSQMVIGGNPFSGFSHQSPQRDREMLDYYTAARIKETLAAAEAAGVNTFFGRADNHVMRTLREYWLEGGTIQWVAQTASERPDFLRNIKAAAAAGAKGIYLHGGQSDFFYHNDQRENFQKALDAIHSAGLPAGFAAHEPPIHEWIRDHVQADFQMCSYYNPSPRADSPHHDPLADETFDPADRDRMAAVIRTIPCPVVHYKVLAAGRSDPAEAFAYVARAYRCGDVVCVGVYRGDDADLIAKDVRLLTAALSAAAVPAK